MGRHRQYHQLEREEELARPELVSKRRRNRYTRSERKAYRAKAEALTS